MLTEEGKTPTESHISERRADALDNLLVLYRNHFDIALNRSICETIVPAMASFRSRGEKYMLVKSAKIWAVECYEHALFFTPATLNANELRKITDLLKSAEKELVKPGPEHMYTYLSAIVITDSATEEAKALARKYKWRKFYRFSLYGWCHIRIAVLDLSCGTIITNRDGNEMRKALSSVLGESM